MSAERVQLLTRPDAWAAYLDLPDPLDLPALLTEYGDARLVAAEVLDYVADQTPQAAPLKSVKIGSLAIERTAPLVTGPDVWRARARDLRGEARRDSRRGGRGFVSLSVRPS